MDFKRKYSFNFNRAWLQVDDFSQLVQSSWSFEVTLSDNNAMSSLVYKLKILKGVVKGWGKSQKEKQCKALVDLNHESLCLFLPSIKIQRENLLAHEALT